MVVSHGKQKVQKAGSSSAQLHAEKLFEAKPIADIREIEKRTRKDVDLKKQQLRQLVGDSYRDLIESADKIVAISNICGQIISNVNGIQGGFASLAHNFASSDSLLHEKRDSLTMHEELHAIGTRIKYLIDTPEVIWGSLDSRRFLEAARRLLRAHQVHSMLLESFSREALAKFPLLDHHWPLVEKFRKQILDSVHAVLASDAALGTEAATDALAAACALDGLGSLPALQLLLASRSSCLSQRLASEAESGGTFDAVLQLAGLAQSIQTTIGQVGELFLPHAVGAMHAGCASCLLQASIVEEESDASELLFSSRGTLSGSATGASAVEAPEAAAWRRSGRAVFEGLAALTLGQVEKACMAWLRGVAASFASHAEPLLLVCTTASKLVDVEHAVHRAISAWQLSVSPAAHAQSGSLAHQVTSAATSAKNSSVRGFPGAASPRGTAEASGTLSHSWDVVCQRVLGFPLNLWQEVFHAPFLVQCKRLIAGSFAAVAQVLAQPLQACMAAAATAMPVAPGCLSAARWPLVPPEVSSSVWRDVVKPVGMKRSWSEKTSGLKGTSGIHPASNKVEDATGFRQGIQRIRQHFDDELHSILLSVLLLLSAADMVFPGSGSQLPTSHHQRMLQRMPSTVPAGRDVVVRSAELEPFVQDKCAEMAAAVATHLQALLEQVGVLRDGAAGASGAEQVLLLARLSSGLASESKLLPVLLGPPEQWRAIAAAPAGGSGMRARQGGAQARPGPTSQRLQSVVDAIHATGLMAYKCWATWAASSLAGQMRNTMEHDNLLMATSTPLSWQEVVVSMSGHAGSSTDGAAALLMSSSNDAPLADMRFWLPACPSSAAMALLEGSCQEVRRAGDHAAGAEALQMLEWEVAGAALSAVTSLLQRDAEHLLQPAAGSSAGAAASRISEKGVLQLMLDVRSIRDVLAGGRPLRARTPVGTAAAAGGAASSSPVAGLAGAAAELQDPMVAAALAERRKEWMRLEQQLQDRLDPIDWATYEPYFWGNVQRYSQRVSILFGTLLQLQRALPEPGSASRQQQQQPSTSTDTNPLNLLPVAPRFQYLPISAPSVSGPSSGAGAAALSGAGLLMSAGNPGIRGGLSTGATAALASTSDLAGSYSFADLGSGRSVDLAGGAAAVGVAGGSKAGASIGEAATAGMAAGASALSAFQARLQAGFGTMLGDKAAEMTAMAQQRLDNIADFTALGSGLLSSGLFKTAVPKK